MKNYEIGLSPITNNIYIGELNKKGNQWLDKKDITLKACELVALHILNRENALGESAVLEILAEDDNNTKPLFRIEVTDLRA